MKKVTVLLAAAAIVALPMVAAAGIQGDCVDCHTMHNSEQGAPVALRGTSNTPSATPNQNLLRMDCIACHAQDPVAGAAKIFTGAGGSDIPQVAHADASGDLAGGNFRYVLTDDRKGHNITDLITADADNAYAAPGDIRTHNFGPGDGTTGFTCAGATGCHGTRAQMISGYTDPNNTINALVGNTDGSDGADFWKVTQKRQGIAAVSGAHHNNPADQLKNGVQNVVGPHSGLKVAAGYRFIPGLKGLGNSTDLWQNVDANSHNEYFGSDAEFVTADGCNRCHLEGDSSVGGSARMTYNSTLKVPNQSMSGFCSTCHGNFHSSNLNDGNALTGDFANNGTSGAFLRHPSDHILPTTGEYAAYTAYDVTAPVARQDLTAIADTAVVVPGDDMVMCLSCHKPHASQYDYMLRFDYTAMTAGNYADIPTAQAAGGCLACHTTKGVLPENR